MSYIAKHFSFSFVFIAIIAVNLYAQDSIELEYHFQMDKQLNTTSVKDQSNSETCWTFAMLSLIESELLRTGKGYYDLSEMFIVRHTYIEKAIKYVRMHGTINFGGGGEANDVAAVIKSAGIVPESVYPGNHFSVENFNFDAMDRALKRFVDGIVRSNGDKLDLSWKTEFEEMLDTYLGPVPDNFIWQGIRFTPLSFAENLGLNMDDYILIGSYTHHPFYEKFILEIPDNWSWEQLYNVPLDDMMDILDHSVIQGYSVVCATDITETGFSFSKGLAVNKEMNNPPVTQEMRQEGFDNYETQDDHAMHIVGIARDAHGNKYYYAKNSWGHENPFKGYLFVSEDYVRYKTISIMVNKNALEPEQMRRLNMN